MPSSFSLDNIIFWEQICPKLFKWERLENSSGTWKYENGNQHITIYPCTKFESILRTWYCETKFVKKLQRKKMKKSKCQNRDSHVKLTRFSKCDYRIPILHLCSSFPFLEVSIKFKNRQYKRSFAQSSDRGIQALINRIPQCFAIKR